jgi:hypothetical protein
MSPSLPAEVALGCVAIGENGGKRLACAETGRDPSDASKGSKVSTEEANSVTLRVTIATEYQHVPG